MPALAQQPAAVPPAAPVAPIDKTAVPKPPKPPPEQPDSSKPPGRKRSYGCLGAMLAVGLFGVVAWVLSGLMWPTAADEQCESALNQSRIALAATRVDEARTAHDQAAAVCPADHSVQIEALALEIEQAEEAALCAGVEAEAAALLGRALPRRAQRLLDEQAPRCGARTGYRNVAQQVDTRIQRAARAMTEARLALQRGDLDATEAALNRAKQSDAGVVGDDAVRRALERARQAALEPPLSAPMPPAELPLSEPVPAPAISPPRSVEPALTTVPEPSRPDASSAMQRRITELLRGGENDLARRNYRGAITKAETALVLDPGNRSAGDLKRRAEAAENEALRDMEIH